MPAERAGRDARVFIVDDHPAMRSMIRSACDESSSLTVVGEAGDGLKALEEIRRLEPDVVVLDLNLPGLSGLELLRILHDEGARTRFVILTARDDAGALFEAVRADVAGYLDKNAALPELVDAIEAVAAGETVITDVQHKRARRQLGEFVRQSRESARAAERLTEREREVLDLIRDGLTTRQMATRLALSPRTIESHISSAYRKLGVTSRVQAVAKADALNLLGDRST